MLHLLLVIDLRGDVDQSGLERLRCQLGLRKQGRLTDDWDQQFGHRTSQLRSGRRLKISLLRQFDGSWILQVLSDQAPDASAVELAQLRSELVSGVRAAGYEATVRQKPAFGTADRG